MAEHSQTDETEALGQGNIVISVAKLMNMLRNRLKEYVVIGANGHREEDRRVPERTGRMVWKEEVEMQFDKV